MIRTISYWLIVSLTFASGCASKKFNEPGVLETPTAQTHRMFRRSYTDVWNAALAALQNQKYAVSESKRDGGIISTDWISGKSERLFSGYGETRIPYTIRFRMSVRLVPSQLGIKVSVDGDEQYYSDAITAGTDFSGSVYQWMPTKSSGTKEAALLNEIQSQLSEQHPSKTR